MIKVNDKIINFKTFNDGTLRLSFTPSTHVFQNITWLYDNESEVMQLYFLMQHMRRAWGVERINLLCPYCPNSRMDRALNRDECFTLKYFADFINSLHFTKVEVFDPHSFVTAALVENLQTISPKPLIEDILRTDLNLGLCFTDEGGMKKYHKMFNMPYCFGVKCRDWETQQIESLKLLGATHNISGRDFLICDDILSRGSTAYLCAKRLKEMGARNIYLYVSHCENTVLGPHMQGRSLLDIPNLITKIYTTNSIFRSQHEKIEVIHEF